jgi:hypothetical protein
MTQDIVLGGVVQLTHLIESTRKNLIPGISSNNIPGINRPKPAIRSSMAGSDMEIATCELGD